MKKYLYIPLILLALGSIPSFASAETSTNLRSLPSGSSTVARYWVEERVVRYHRPYYHRYYRSYYYYPRVIYRDHWRHRYYWHHRHW